VGFRRGFAVFDARLVRSVLRFYGTCAGGRHLGGCWVEGEINGWSAAIKGLIENIFSGAGGGAKNAGLEKAGQLNCGVRKCWIYSFSMR